MPSTKSGFYHALDDKLSSNFNIKIAHRILSAIMEHGRLNRTNLAGKTGLNYVRCAKYVKILLMLGWVKPFFAGQDYLTITDKGREFVNQVSNA